MNQAIFIDSLKKTKKLLKELRLSKHEGIKNTFKDGVSEEFRKASQQKDYFKLFKTAVKNFDYDLMMYDESIFQFSFLKKKQNPIPEIRFAFFQNPQLYISYSDYLKYLQKENLIDEDEDLEDIGMLYENEYNQFCIEQQLNTSNTTIRFDVDEPRHAPLIHSVAHFHFGHVTTVRIPCDKIITPLGFVVFILKHCYYKEWKNLIKTKDKSLIEILNNQRKHFPLLKSLKQPCWHDDEEKELYVS